MDSRGCMHCRNQGLRDFRLWRKAQAARKPNPDSDKDEALGQLSQIARNQSPNAVSGGSRLPQWAGQVVIFVFIAKRERLWGRGSGRTKPATRSQVRIASGQIPSHFMGLQGQVLTFAVLVKVGSTRGAAVSNQASHPKSGINSQRIPSPFMDLER